MRAGLLLILAALSCSATAATRVDAPVPTVVLPTHLGPGADADGLAAQPGYQWLIDFGSERLVGVSAESLTHWLAFEGSRPGPPLIARDEIVVRDLVCTQHYPEPVVAVVGGYSLVRRPAALARVAGLGGMGGMPVPKDGVVARAVSAEAMAKARGATDPAVDALVARIDTERWFNTVSALSAFNRNSFSPGLAQARDYILARFGEAGLVSSSHDFTLSNTSCSPAPPPVQLQNPIGIKLGRGRPERWIVVGAHYDSRNSARCDGSASPQPGANDNASGCAGVIELARAFEQVATEKSIVFACFAGEEQGLVGAYAWVQSLADSGQLANVEHMVNLDMIAHATSDLLDTRIETTSAFQAEFTRYRAAAATYAPELRLIEAGTQAYSDHWPFIARGIPAMFTWENGAGIYPHYHQATDLPQNLLRPRQLAGGILKMDAAVLAGLAVLTDAPMFADGFESAD
ncbi:MAG: M28 family metallopeptidase [Aquimonas sp.]